MNKIKNIQQKVVAARITYQDNLVYWIEDVLIGRNVSRTFDKRIERSWSEYCDLFLEKSSKWIDDYNWVSDLGNAMLNDNDAKNYFEFTAQQQQSLKEFLDLFYNDFNRFGTMLFRRLAFILGKFENAKKLETPEAKALIANYEFAKIYLIEKFPNEWKQYRTYVESNTNLPEEKPITCPECGSEEITSFNRMRWVCKNCNRMFMKNPRSKKQN